MTCCPIVELRQYTLVPGRREALIELFDREFVETQEAAGMRVIGQFRDRDRPDRFVWMRGFRDMDARARALEAFYRGPIWKTHREAANATMLDSDDVLLLRPVASGFSLAGLARGPARTPELYAITIYYLAERPAPHLVERIDRELPPGGVRFVTEHSPNTFPALPVREGEHVFVVFGARADAVVPPALATTFAKPPETLHLTPTLRSLVGFR